MSYGNLMDFATFRTKYPARSPRADVIKNADELRQMQPEDGLGLFDRNSGQDAIHSKPPRVAHDRGELYLWAISASDVPFALENVPFGKGLASRVIKHTNLTGGGHAHSGGELWFLSTNEILVNGASGRYGPETNQELVDAATAFKDAGYKVASLGFDEETGYSNRILVGDPQWL